MNGTFTTIYDVNESRVNRAPSATQTSSHLKKVVFGVTLGNMVEWFQFALYSSMATIIGGIFFHNESPRNQLVAVYAIFAAGFLVRPLGSLVFGSIGDRFGRRTALTLSITLMTIATFCIALIPSYESIGVMAPVLLILMRLFQGLSTGGEYGGSLVFIAEHAPDNRRSFFVSWLEAGILAGILLGALLVSGLMFVLGEETIQTWGWRIPLVIGGFLGVIAMYLRLSLQETPTFEALQKSKCKLAATRRNITSRLIHEWPQLLKSVGLVVVYNICYYVVLGYLPIYLADLLGHSRNFGSLLAIIGMLSMMLLAPFSGLLADRVGGNLMITLACTVLIVFSIPAFFLLQTHNMVSAYVAVLGLLVAQWLFVGAIGGTLVSLFKAPVRFSALALSFNVSISAFGATAPLINTLLISDTGNTMIPAYYLIAAAIMGLVVIEMVDDRTGKPLP